MRRLILLLSALSLGIASFAAAARDDIIVTAKPAAQNGREYSLQGFGGGQVSGNESGSDSGDDVADSHPSVPYPYTYQEISWPAQIVVAGKTYDVIRTVRCNCVIP